jgi:hypothetical protein
MTLSFGFHSDKIYLAAAVGIESELLLKIAFRVDEYCLSAHFCNNDKIT